MNDHFSFKVYTWYGCGLVVEYMAISDISITETPLLEDVVNGTIDYKGRPDHRSNSGGWKSALFIIERSTIYGISSNLVTYLTGQLGESTATAAENVNAWSGTAALMPLVGAIVADTFIGGYRTIVISSVIYILGLGLLTLSAILPFSSDCQNTNSLMSCSPPQLQVTLFFFSLYLVAIAQGGHKPCVEAFGADQFDGNDLEKSKARSSFFNWLYFGLCAGIFVTFLVVIYIQDNLNWGIGFGIPCIEMVVSLALFLLGTKTYRYSIKRDEKSPFVRIGVVFVTAFKNRHTTASMVAIEEEGHRTLPHQSFSQYKFLNKALLAPNGSKEDENVCGIEEVEEAKAVLRLVPIWASSLIYAIVFVQSSTFFTKQGATMDRTITSGFRIPSAALQSLISLTIIIFIPIYDCVFVPIARSITRKPSGITTLQRIGIGMFFSAVAMVVAALVEMKRLKIVHEYGLEDMPNATVPMSVWWLVPQYVLFGAADAFTMVGLQEFFYDQVPNELRSVGISLYLSIFGVGSFLSSFLVAIIDNATSGSGHQNWFASNLNQAHLYYFYWLLAGISALGVAVYIYFAKSYIYNKGSSTV